MKAIRALLAHLLYHKETYFLPGLIASALYFGILAVTWIDGRPPADDVGVIVGFLLNGLGAAVVLFFTGQTQEHFFGYRSKSTGATFRDDVFDAAVAAFLLCFYAVLIFSLAR